MHANMATTDAMTAYEAHRSLAIPNSLSNVAGISTTIPARDALHHRDDRLEPRFGAAFRSRATRTPARNSGIPLVTAMSMRIPAMLVTNSAPRSRRQARARASAPRKTAPGTR
ncbi:MAG: hypothetical protein EBU31_01715, partial [Proteobacteria bacterium]|nr:hypothetical protein [Pseudomonadota bacterium]